ADLLSGDLAVAEFYEAALKTFDEPQTVATWFVNELLPELTEREIESLSGVSKELLTPEGVAQLVAAFAKERITNQISRRVLGTMLDTGDLPEDIIRNEGLERITDTGALGALVDQILADNDDAVTRYAAGKR